MQNFGVEKIAEKIQFKKFKQNFQNRCLKKYF